MTIDPASAPNRASSPRLADELEPEEHETSKLELLEYTIASRDPNLIHHDPEHARASGLPDAIVQGGLKAALLARFVEERMGDRWHLDEFAVQYRGMDMVGETLTARGRVVSVDPSGQSVQIDVWFEDSDGSPNTRAHARLVPV
jgi:acyl dehydratase